MQQSEIVALAKAAGLSDSAAVTASAVAMGESGGDPRQHTVGPRDDSYGLWQINMLGSMGPTRRKLYGLASNDDLFDPATNAHIMSLISSKGRDWSAWGAYTNGSYKEFLPKTPSASTKLIGDAAKAGSKIVGGVKDVVGAAADVATSASQAVDALQRVGTWIAAPKNWVRVAYVAGGGALVVTALAQIIMSTSAGKAAVGAGRTAITKGLA